MTALFLAGILLLLVYNQQRLPFDGIAAARSGRWHTFGGLWSLQNDEIVDRSDEPGAKLLSGSPDWRNVRFDADIRTSRRRGEAGLIVRANHMGVGINAYDGYYAGYRSMDNSLRSVSALHRTYMTPWPRVSPASAINCKVFAAGCVKMRTCHPT